MEYQLLNSKIRELTDKQSVFAAAVDGVDRAEFLKQLDNRIASFRRPGRSGSRNARLEPYLHELGCTHRHHFVLRYSGRIGEVSVKKLAAISTLFPGIAFAIPTQAPPVAPEIHPGSLISASALVGSILVMARSRRKS